MASVARTSSPVRSMAPYAKYKTTAITATTEKIKPNGFALYGVMFSAAFSCNQHFHLAHLGQPVRSRIGDGCTPNEVNLAIFHAYHDGLDSHFRFLYAEANIESEAGLFGGSPKRRFALGTQILGNHLFARAEVGKDQPRRCAIKEPEIHVRQAVLQ